VHDTTTTIWRSWKCILQCRPTETELWPQSTCAEKIWSTSAIWFLRYARLQIHTDMLIGVLHWGLEKGQSSATSRLTIRWTWWSTDNKELRCWGRDDVRLRYSVRSWLCRPCLGRVTHSTPGWRTRLAYTDIFRYILTHAQSIHLWYHGIFFGVRQHSCS